MQSKPNVLDGPIGASEQQQQAQHKRKTHKKRSFSTLSKYIENKSNQPSSIYRHGILTNSYTGSLKSAAACGLFFFGGGGGVVVGPKTKQPKNAKAVVCATTY